MTYTNPHKQKHIIQLPFNKFTFYMLYICKHVLRQVIGFFNRSKPSSRTIALWSTQPLAEMRTRNFTGCKGRPASKADNLTAICEPICLENLEASMTHNPMGPHGLLKGLLYLYHTSHTFHTSLEKNFSFTLYDLIRSVMITYPSI
jgi:hypothetical protein